MFNSIMTEVYETKLVKDIITNMKVSAIDYDDLEQEIYMILLEYNKQKIIELYNNNQLKYFIVGIVQRQYNSITSPFYKKYKKYYSIIDANVINKDDLNEDDE